MDSHIRNISLCYRETHNRHTLSGIDYVEATFCSDSLSPLSSYSNYLSEMALLWCTVIMIMMYSEQFDCSRFDFFCENFGHHFFGLYPLLLCLSIFYPLTTLPF